MATEGKWRHVGHLPLLGSQSSLGLRIKSVRLFAGLSQVAFAERLGVARSYLSEVESEKGKPSIEMITGIAANFSDIDPSWLLSGRGQMIVGQQPGAILGAVRTIVVSELTGRPAKKGAKGAGSRRKLKGP